MAGKLGVDSNRASCSVVEREPTSSSGKLWIMLRNGKFTKQHKFIVFQLHNNDFFDYKTVAKKTTQFTLEKVPYASLKQIHIQKESLSRGEVGITLSRNDAESTMKPIWNTRKIRGRNAPFNLKP